MTVQLSNDSLSTAGILLITVVGIAYGGVFLLKVFGGKVPTTDFQKAFFRAGHAHAGVLVTLSLVCTVLADATDLPRFWDVLAREGVPVAAILMPAGFFLSAIGSGRTEPNRLKVLLYLGGLSLSVGVLTLGIGLILAVS